MLLSDALQYPFRGKDWFHRMLTLALLQLIPIVGQVILFGYGIAIVRAVYAGETKLPLLQWRQALCDGGLFVVAGLLYLTPILGLIPNVVMFEIAVRFLDIELVPGSLIANTMYGVFALVLTLLIVLIVSGLYVGGVRYAVESKRFKGLFGATGNAKLLLRNRDASRTLIVNMFLVGLVAVVGISFGLVFLILPGLFMFVSCSLTLWYLFARYGLEVGVNTSGFAA
ncbi:MAG: DUF4013 domain-containing protein [Chloroflexales bacterium]|nr:DUF4013 domain-containing protein [Chloroflexales bacterium]